MRLGDAAGRKVKVSLSGRLRWFGLVVTMIIMCLFAPTVALPLCVQWSSFTKAREEISRRLSSAGRDWGRHAPDD
jgi:hypothetical protein